MAEREGISQANAGKVLWTLNKAGLVASGRGTKGGYRLARPAADIRLSEIISVHGEDVLESHCKTYSGLLDSCVHTGNCGIRPVLVSLHDIVRDALLAITLAELTGTESKVESTIHQIHALPRHGGAVKRV
jgi:Rrf2 family protein